DVGMLQSRDRARLVEESRAGHRVLVGVDELHRDGAIEQRVACEIDLTHGAAAEEPHQAVFLELVGRRPAGVDHVIMRMSLPPSQMSLAPNSSLTHAWRLT